MKRLAVDLVILNERASSMEELQNALETLVRASLSRPQIGDERPSGHTVMLRADLISPEVLALLEIRRACRPVRRARKTRRSARARA